MRATYKANLRTRLVKQQGGRCAICNRSLVPQKATLDHIIPRSRGGPGSAWNYQAAHAHCNKTRGRNLDPGIDVTASLFERRLIRNRDTPVGDR